MYNQTFDDGSLHEEDELIFTEYSVDDTLDSLTRLKKYCSSDFHLQRLILVREIYDICLEVGFEKSSTEVLPLIENFLSDNESTVRKALAEQLYPLSVFFFENGESKEEKYGYQQLINTFIPFTFELIIDKKIDVSDTATHALCEIAEMIHPEHVEPQLFEVIKNLAHDDQVEVYRIASAKLFNVLSPIFGKKLCQTRVVEEVVQLSKDSSLSVRKTVAQNLNKISEIIGEDESVKKILPVYLDLSRDEIWGVRKACVETLPIISSNVTSKVRVGSLTQLFEEFTDDISRWVKIEAFRQLGKFITTFKPNEITENLIQYFTDMAFQGDQSDSDLVEFCAYNFPGVAETIGKDRWYLIERAYKCLVKDVQWKVRRSLACSLHEVAKVVGTEITETVLCNAFHIFLKDLDDVKIGVVSNVSKFLKVISKEKRIDYLDVITQIPEETENWRIKNKVAEQLSDLLKLFDGDLLSRQKILNLFLALLIDEYSIIRKTTASISGDFLQYLIILKDFENVKDFMLYVKKFVKQSWIERQLYVDICHYLVNSIPSKDFENDYLPGLLTLVNDKVANVKVRLAQVLNNDILQNENWKDDNDVLNAIKILRKDSDIDVLFFSNQSNVSLHTALMNVKIPLSSISSVN